jgi:hypothetical protein
MLATIQSRSFPSHLLYRNIKFRIYKAIIMPLALMCVKLVSDIKGRTQSEGV